jgi:hypothetical protein
MVWTTILGERLLGSCLKFVHIVPLPLRLRLRYAQGERGHLCIRTDAVHEPTLAYAGLRPASRAKRSISLSISSKPSVHMKNASTT